MSYKATAAQLGISVSAVEKHVTKALRVVSARLQEFDERQPATKRSFR
jgi:RNA polymerase sigma-70 factor (ECF subfamily)